MIGSFLRFSIMTIAQTNYDDCLDELPHGMFEEGGRVWLCVLRVCDVLQLHCSCLLTRLFVL